MKALRAPAVLLVGLSVALALPPPSEAQEAVAAEWAVQALRSPAAKWFATTAGAYLFDKTVDWVWFKYNQPDTKELNKRIAKLQTDYPEYSLDLEALKGMLKPDVKKDEFEQVFNHMTEKIDQRALMPQRPGDLSPSQLFPALRPQPLPSLLVNELRPRPRLWDLGAQVRGAWAFEVASPDGSDHTAGCHIFGADGAFLSQWAASRDRIDSVAGTYTTDGHTVKIQWASGDVETAALDQVDANHLRYELTSHSRNPALVGLKIFLTRVSDPVTTSLIAVRNPTFRPIIFDTRWALMDGMWTEWKRWTIAPFETRRITGRGGIHCQIQFDSSFAEGYQAKLYCLPFDIATTPLDPLPKSGGTPYRFEINGDEIDLKDDYSIAPINTPLPLFPGLPG